MAKNYTVKINSVEKIEQLLQEIYDQTVKQHNEIQNEMNKMSNSCNLADATIEERTKYSKAMHDLIGDKTKTLSLKFDVAKFLGEMVKHNGDVNKTLDDPAVGKATKFDLAAWKKEINAIATSNDVENYDLKINGNAQ